MVEEEWQQSSTGRSKRAASKKSTKTHNQQQGRRFDCERRSETRKSGGFGSRSWTKPDAIAGGTKEEGGDTRNTNDTHLELCSSIIDNAATPGGVDREYQVTQAIGSIIASEIAASSCDADDDSQAKESRELNAAIASTAAMAMLSSIDAFGLRTTTDENDSIEKSDDAVVRETDVANSGVVADHNEQHPEADVDFASRCNMSLSKLLVEEYGEKEDLPDKKKDKVREDKMEQKQDRAQQVRNNGSLARHGKAPIHVEIISFGFKYGAPPRSDGWSHSRPLAPLDCRDLPEAPCHVSRLSGLSYQVKRVLLRSEKVVNDSTEVPEKCDPASVEALDISAKCTTKAPRRNSLQARADELALEVMQAIEDAILEGAASHASPIQMSVYVGSDLGRHRSVVLCEVAATSLRKLLRGNEGGRITQPVSVGTRHRDVDRKKRDG